jgi:hypothetical protein
MGIADMTWAFNGNVLLVSSNDGSLACVHFKPGFLGERASKSDKINLFT